MQAITIAIGSAGIHFFAQQYLADQITTLLKTLTPPDHTIPVDDFSYGDGTDTWTISNLSIQLTKGSMSGYDPGYQGVDQGMSNGVALFTLNFPSAATLQVDYAWQESYNWEDRGFTEVNGRDYPYDHKGSKTRNYAYSPVFSSLNVQVVVQFGFDAQTNAWEISVQSASGDATSSKANIPKDSVLQNQSTGSCSFSSHVSEATTQAVDSIDFATPISGLISGILKSIPGSGDLGNGITYDFSLGDGGIAFPGNDGIQMGVKGGASYNGAVFSESPVPSLPFPLPPADTDTHHLNLYVSSFEIDALYWAYYEADKLDLSVTPQDLSNPAALAVSSYSSWEPALEPYAANQDVMNAEIQPNSAPTTSFQTVYVFGTAAMNQLQTQLPAEVYQSIERLAVNPFLSQQDLENLLTQIQVPQQYFLEIENAGQVSAMVVNHDLTFNLVIQDTAYGNPYIKFQVKRTDILTDLALGLAGQAQTLQFGFVNALNTATFLESSVPGFDGSTDFGGPLWNVTGETLYADNLQALGKQGVPLPMMQDFQFDFANAELSVQEGYVSILANVLYLA